MPSVAVNAAANDVHSAVRAKAFAPKGRAADLNDEALVLLNPMPSPRALRAALNVALSVVPNAARSVAPSVEPSVGRKAVRHAVQIG